MKRYAIIDRDPFGTGASWATDRDHLILTEAEFREQFNPNRLRGIDVIDLGELDGEDALALCPSAGDGDLWEDDPWHGIADWISYRSFAKLLGVDPGMYCFPNWRHVAKLHEAEKILPYLPATEAAELEAEIENGVSL